MSMLDRQSDFLQHTTESRSEYDDWHARVSASETANTIVMQPWHRSALELAGSIAGLRVLEVGCGRGDFAIRLADEKPSELVAMDYSPVAIETGKRRAAALGKPVRFLCGDGQSLPFKDSYFDLILSCETLEHVFRPRAMTGEIARVLRPDGRYVLTTENYFNGTSLAWLKAWATRQPFDSGSGVQPIEHFFVWWRVRSLLRASGLTVDRMSSNHYQWLLLPRVDPAKLCTFEFRSAWLRRTARPFGRHFTFAGRRDDRAEASERHQFHRAISR